MEQFILSKNASITLNFETGEVCNILKGGRQVNNISAPLFTVKLRKKTGESYQVNATQCAFVSYQNQTAVYTSEFFNAQLRFQILDDALRCRIHMQNKTQDMFEWVEVLPFAVGKKLKDEEGGRGEIIYPYNEGCKVADMAYRESMPFRYTEPEYPSKGSYSIFPNMISSQFIAYIDDGAGIYLGMHDNERTTKHVDFCYFEEGIRVFMRAFCDVHYGQDYQMPFDTILCVFEGSWHNAADIYYHWFKDNLPAGLTKIRHNTALPSWYKEYPLVVAYPVRGKHDTDLSENGMYPYKNALPFLEEVAAETDGKVMALLMHWESSAPWAPPFYWPPYGGKEEFCEFVNELHARDMLAGLYCSGMGFTKQSNVDKSYAPEEAYHNLGIEQCACTNSNGEISSTICLAQREGVDLCPACQKTKNMLKAEFDAICESGIDYLQALDQNHGGNSYFCYSDQHEHVPAPGKWQQIETNKLLSSIDKKGVLFGCESAAAEPFLSQLQFSDNRYELNYYHGVPIPVYAYLYHEYVNNFMGNQICAMLDKTENNFTYRMAYSFAAGDMLTLVTNGNGNLLYSWCDCVPPTEKNVDKVTAFRFIKELTAWRKKPAGKFLHYGKMIAPMDVVCAEEQIYLFSNGSYLKIPAALSGAYELDGERVQFLVNYNLHAVDVEFAKECEVYLSADLTDAQKTAKLTIPPLSVAMLKM